MMPSAKNVRTETSDPANPATPIDPMEYQVNQPITPPVMTFDRHGLTFEHSTAWLAPEYTPVAAPRMLRDAAGGAAPTAPDAPEDFDEPLDDDVLITFEG